MIRVGSNVERPDVQGAARMAALFDRHARELFRYCARRVGPHLAEDIVGDVFLVVARRHDRIDAGGSAKAWLYGIAVNLLRTHQRAELRGYRVLERTGVDPFGGATGVVEGPERRGAERVDASLQGRRIAGALARLPARQREVLLLFAIGELSYAEIAEATGLPLGTVQSSLHRARTRMRDALGAHPGGEQ